jgi:hypothetical protein
MARRALSPAIADAAPASDTPTDYDQDQAITYLGLLDAEADGADWTEAASVVLRIDPKQEPERARRAWQIHLARAKWMTERGYKHLLQVGLLPDRSGAARDS